jgi:hypothetical protein
VLDVNDPYHPKEVARWKTEGRPDAGRSLHDMDIRDGLLYASYWNDGLVVLDIGNGMKGGSPSKPTLVSQFKYDLNALYKQVEAGRRARIHSAAHTPRGATRTTSSSPTKSFLRPESKARRRRGRSRVRPHAGDRRE